VHFALQNINYQMPPNDYGSADGMSPQQPEGPHQELMQTESENRLLRHRLNTTQDQATGIESSLAEVAQLTELFTQQVMSQSEQIETLYDEVRAERLLICARQMAGLRCHMHVALLLYFRDCPCCSHLCLVHKNQACHNLCIIASEAAGTDQAPSFLLLGQNNS